MTSSPRGSPLPQSPELQQSPSPTEIDQSLQPEKPVSSQLILHSPSTKMKQSQLNTNPLTFEPMISNVPTLDHVQQFHSNSTSSDPIDRNKSIIQQLSLQSFQSNSTPIPFKEGATNPYLFIQNQPPPIPQVIQIQSNPFFPRQEPTSYETFSTPQTIIQLPLPQSSQTQPNYNF